MKSKRKRLRKSWKEKGFKISLVVRMKKDKTTPYSMMAVTSEKPEKGKKIFQVNNVAGLRVRVKTNKPMKNWTRLGNF